MVHLQRDGAHEVDPTYAACFEPSSLARREKELARETTSAPAPHSNRSGASHRGCTEDKSLDRSHSGVAVWHSDASGIMMSLHRLQVSGLVRPKTLARQGSKAARPAPGGDPLSAERSIGVALAAAVRVPCSANTTPDRKKYGTAT